MLIWLALVKLLKFPNTKKPFLNQKASFLETQTGSVFSPLGSAPPVVSAADDAGQQMLSAPLSCRLVAHQEQMNWLFESISSPTRGENVPPPAQTHAQLLRMLFFMGQTQSGGNLSSIKYLQIGNEPPE